MIAANDNEEWRVCVLAPNYSVSNLARIKDTNSGRLLKPYLMEGRYRRIRLMVDGVRKHFLLHVLVCWAFVGAPPFSNAIVLHENDDTSNNMPSNLRWGTHADNARDAKRNGRVRKRTSKVVLAAVRSALNEDVSVLALSKQYGLAPSNIRGIRLTLRAANDNTPSSKGVAA